MLSLYSCDGEASYAFLEQVWLQCRARKAVACVLDHHWLISSRFEKIHQLERRAVSSKPFVLVSMQKEDDRQTRSSICFDEGGDILLESGVASSVPAGARLERVLSIYHQQGRLRNSDLVGTRHRCPRE